MSRVASGIGHGMALAMRSSAAGMFLGLRWAGHRGEVDQRDIPDPHWSLGLRGKIVLDEFFFATEVVTAALTFLPDARRIGREIQEAAGFFDARGWIDDPADYHRAPPALTRVTLEERRSRGIDHRHLTFESDYEPHPGEPGRERWQGYEVNRTAHARLLEHPGPPRPWLVCVPGYRMGHPAADFTGFRARWLHFELGLNVAIPIMPLHGPRSVGRRGGDGFLSGDMLDTIHAQTQAVWDVRRLADWLRAQGAPSVGLYGVSLGGYTAALLASLEGEFDCVVAGVPATDFMGLMRAHAPSFALKAAEWVGFSFEPVDRIMRVISPLAIPVRVPRNRLFLFAGVADRLTAPHQARNLWEHWERPRLAWYHGTHISFLWEKEVQALLEEALSTSGLIQRRRLTAA